MLVRMASQEGILPPGLLWGLERGFEPENGVEESWSMDIFWPIMESYYSSKKGSIFPVVPRKFG